VTLLDPIISSGRPIKIQPDAEDIDVDSISFEYQWTIDDEEIFLATESILPGEYVQRGQKISVTITPFDESGAGEPYISQPLKFTDLPPEFISSPPENFQVAEYRYRALAGDPEGGSLIYQLENPPPGMTIDESTGELVWPIPADAEGNVVVTIIAEAGNGMVARQSFSIQLHLQETGQ
jgi:hypothetical protein